jgi:hypothetical protein
MGSNLRLYPAMGMPDRSPSSAIGRLKACQCRGSLLLIERDRGGVRYATATAWSLSAMRSVKFREFQ